MSLANVKATTTKGESRSRTDAPEAEELPEAFWATAVRVERRPAKQSVPLRVDADVLAWFRSQGAGHLTLMNEAYQSANGSVTKIVSARSGLVDSIATGASISSSMRLTYLMQCEGNCAQLRAPCVESVQPGSVS